MNENIKLVPYTDDDYEFVYEVKKNAYKKYVEECWSAWIEEDQRTYFEKFITTVKDNYIQFEFVKDDLKHIFKVTDMVISRAGANSIFEFLSLNLTMLLIPLPLSQSRGGQI